MRRTGPIVALAFALALTLLGRIAPASADTVPQSAQAAPATAVPVNPTADQFDSWARLSENQWLEALEEGCIKTGSDACKMTDQQARKLLSDTKKLTRELHDEIMNNPAEVNELKAAKKQKTRAATALASKAAAIISKYTRHQAVKNLNKVSDKVGDIAGYQINGTYAVNGLKEGTEEAIAKSIVYMVPVLGDVWSLGEAVANRDVESGVVAVVSLIATAASFAFPPAGVLLASALATYYVAKLIIGFLCSEERDWAAEPPGTPEELFKSGADIRWEKHRVAGKDVVAIIPPTGYARQTLLLDSKWTQYNADRRPVKYSLDELIFSSAGFPKTVEVWQGGREVGSVTCTYLTDVMLPGETDPNGSDIIAGVNNCNLESTATISLGNPAVIVLEYAFPDKSPCSGTPCVPSGQKNVLLGVKSEGRGNVTLDLPFHYAFISSLSEVYASGEFTYEYEKESSEGTYLQKASISRPEHGKCYNFISPTTEEVQNSTDRKATVWYGRDCKGTKVTVPAGSKEKPARGADFDSVMFD
ncbi:hypothetical protein ACIPLC_27695 [Kitasatospora sp. NPDC086801]|uniref:hypothetical protein n=1 Tax=Kitasatospora sp. NPDC086801 TaxID=3364066 RepID=UPI003813B8DD